MTHVSKRNCKCRIRVEGGPSSHQSFVFRINMHLRSTCFWSYICQLLHLSDTASRNRTGECDHSGCSQPLQAMTEHRSKGVLFSAGERCQEAVRQPGGRPCDAGASVPGVPGGGRQGGPERRPRKHWEQEKKGAGLLKLAKRSK